ncbi:MBOAT family protein [bacterium (Candidatus Blackallbacteria) CG17_big_fil_post_rev_8_21_14_2_50_48_46]|uniref:MBOAT family protein n=1 Tax=bacterium (Candidatus Blackallbacteria) CG17_big_fil_post_rev_8_21_14_2_50_48_46 TaxID=2014261 RepID=A0A2M7FYE7_9BACT|nr:MAG: membrane-bound O-acyltransferase family protein [bacterium (Candidatus Blackallbacteria) CG18_big_fil_WC_8_21_14_2_50_49_26]PIW13786.1 MAG: MBOAT family protein [bacterium (Candidatus Blackallbacteria) CG17_big_fil_post_rev_8_21_14_2_50_48_46]PIW45012.1 MAG: MBOAT family protein [bacterium (Candidatus Blackallbacteria) CG13_big_fil_rev_8_21_14_2_50_49_14]
MIFNEALYGVFLLFSVAVFFLLPLSWRAGWLALTGLVFYGWYGGPFVWLFLVEALLVYAAMRFFRGHKQIFVLFLLLSIGVLVGFKYRNLLLGSWYELQHALSGSGVPTLQHFVFPLAISFFSFEFIHYLIDCQRGKIGPHRLRDYLAFILFFPTMVAGPIKRFQDFVPKLNQARFDWEHLRMGLLRIVVGMGKKMVIADSLDLWVQPLLSEHTAQSASGLTLWIALFAYSVKIYTDFSGYSDIAIGSARLFGIVVPENFNWPYLRRNIAEFWRHWHISLSSWITDYVYISLGGSRVRFPRLLLNLVLALGVSGIWHGAEWHFLVWGLYHGMMLALHRIFRDKISPRLPVLKRIDRFLKPGYTLLTFVLVTLGWGLFIMPVSRFVGLLPRLLGLN